MRFDMIQLKRSFFIIILLIFVGRVAAQEPLTLGDAIVRGLENNFDIRISKEEYNIARLNNHPGTAGRLPSVEVGVNNSNRYGNSPIFNPNTFEFGRNEQKVDVLTPYVELRWLLFDGFSVSMNKNKLELLEHFSNGLSTIVIENTLQAIILGYYFALLEIERLQVLREVKELSGDRFQYEMLRKDIGTSVTFEVLQAKNSFYSDSTNFLLQDNFEKAQPNTYLYNIYGNFSLSFNLYNGGNTRRAIEQARINEKIGTLEIAQLKQTLENLLVNQYELYGIRRQLLEVAEVNLASARLNLEIATEKYRNGTINSFNFRDVQLIFLNASANKLNAVYDLIDSETELLRLTGGILVEQ
ncbi:MAG: TolC family protein [bacterium]